MIVISSQNPKAIQYAKSVAVYISRTPCATEFLTTAMDKLHPRSLQVLGANEIEEITSKKYIPAVNLFHGDVAKALSKYPGKTRLSPGYLLVAFLVDVTIEMDQISIIEHLPLLLNLIFVHLDASVVKSGEMRLLLINLLQLLLKRQKSKTDRVDATITALNMKEGKRIWKFEDSLPGTNELESEAQMGALVLEILDLFRDIYPDLAHDWSFIAIYWGTKCHDYHIACRSLQIFRKLQKFNFNYLGMLIGGLTTSVSDTDTNTQRYSNELLLSIKNALSFISADDIMYDFPQLFWACVALLSSIHEWEFLMGLEMITSILKKLDLNDVKALNLLVSTIPKGWDGGFDGLMKLLCRGLSSSNIESLTIETINSLLFVSTPILL
jgi:hypothetical protein